MDDNVRPHRVNIVYECLQSEDITCMDWPAHSPAYTLNPIDHVWDMLRRRIAARQPSPTCLPELRRALIDEWCNIPQDQIDNLILSMPWRSSGMTEAGIFSFELHPVSGRKGVHLGVNGCRGDVQDKTMQLFKVAGVIALVVINSIEKPIPSCVTGTSQLLCKSESL
ncbi:transposable element Tc3 transposase [Trichonephila clavipes]|nr:transposable element Tc3 transposase [Trichonephila clavipes]